jgi:hypothetical protein
MNNANKLPAGYATMLRNLEVEEAAAVAQANRTDRKADHLRVRAIQEEAARVRAGKL